MHGEFLKKEGDDANQILSGNWGSIIGAAYSNYNPNIQNCQTGESDDVIESNANIRDLNCDGQVNQLDALILSNLILEIGDTPDELEQQYPCLIENFNGLTTDDIESLQEMIDMMEDQLNINYLRFQFNCNFYFPKV